MTHENIHKKGSKNECQTASKISENIIKIKLEEYTENILDEEQCDFRKGRSCTDAIFTLQ
jgi:hypothetical protein